MKLLTKLLAIPLLTAIQTLSIILPAKVDAQVQYIESYEGYGHCSYQRNPNSTIHADYCYVIITAGSDGIAYISMLWSAGNEVNAVVNLLNNYAIINGKAGEVSLSGGLLCLVTYQKEIMCTDA